MLILGSMTSIIDGALSIPDYHRGHLSLKTGTAVTIAYLPGKEDNPYPRLSEMIISPIDFRSWEHLTRINTRIANRPGVLRKLMIALAEADLDILYHASGPLENGRFQRVEFLVDGEQFYKRFERLKSVNKNPDPFILFELERWLKSLLINDLCFDGQRARLKVRPMEAFRRTWRAYRKMMMNDEHDRPIKAYSVVERGSLRLPDNIISRMGSNPCIILNSDTKDRMLRASLLENQNTCTFLRVVHRDMPGSSARICSALSNHFQVVTTLSRIKSQGGASDFEFMLFSPRHNASEDELKRRSIIESLLSANDLRDLDIHVSYPDEIGSIGPEPRVPLPGIEANHLQSPLSEICPIEADLMTRSANSILKQRISFFYTQATTTDGFEKPLNSRISYQACRELLCLQGDQEIEHCRIFASYPYVFEDLFVILEEYLSDQGFEIVTGKGIDGRAAYRDTIVDRIKTCHGFVGIWKYDEKAGPIKFSPWLSWELGIAQACGMPVRILPHQSMGTGDFMPHRTILPDINMPPFVDSDFRTYIRQNLATLKSDAQGFEWSKRSEGFNQYSQTN
ncbi:MAG: hypothetical protein ACK58L_12775 [Planctomycetota bacterium]